MHFLVFKRKFFEVLFRPFAIEINACRHAAEPLLVNPLDSLEEVRHMRASHRAECRGIHLRDAGEELVHRFKTAGIIYRASRNIVLVGGPIHGNVDAEVLLFAVIQHFFVEQSAVCVDGEIQGEIAWNQPFVLQIRKNALRVIYTLENRFLPKERFATEKSDVQVFLLEKQRTLEAQLDGSFHGRIVHHSCAIALRIFVIAV